MSSQPPKMQTAHPPTVVDYDAWERGYMPPSEGNVMDAVTDLPPYTVLENGYIHGTWFCGRPTAKYYGAFPQSFWPRAKRVLKPWGSLLHWFSGTVPAEEGITAVDGNPVGKPSVVALGSSLPFEDPQDRTATRNVTHTSQIAELIMDSEDAVERDFKTGGLSYIDALWARTTGATCGCILSVRSSDRRTFLSS